MDYRKANRAFFYSVLATLGMVVLYTIWIIRGEDEMPLALNNVLSELMVLVPVLSVALYHGDRLEVLIPLRKIKVSSALLTILYTVLLYPLLIFVNSFSMLFVDNAVLEASEEILEMPPWTMFLFIGILGPFMEEIIFRGVFLQSYQRSGRLIASIVLSSFLFGLCHMNFNQLAYASAMGVMFALLVEATGSVWPSFISHAFINSMEVLMLYVNSDMLEDAAAYLEDIDIQNEILMSLGIYFILALICTAIAVCVVYKISEIEGRKAFFASIPKCKKQGYKLITVPLVFSVVISFAYMIAILWISSIE